MELAIIVVEIMNVKIIIGDIHRADNTIQVKHLRDHPIEFIDALLHQLATIEKVIVMMLREDMSRETYFQELVIESLEEALKVLLDPQCPGDMKIAPSIHTCLGTEVDLLLRLADILVVHHPQEDIEVIVIVPIQDQLLRQPMVMTTLIRGKQECIKFTSVYQQISSTLLHLVNILRLSRTVLHILPMSKDLEF